MAKSLGVATAGTDADVADRRIAKFEDMLNTKPAVMIVETCFCFALKEILVRIDYNATYNRIKEFIFDYLLMSWMSLLMLLACTVASRWLV